MLQKQANRLRRKIRVGSTITGTPTRPRLSVFRSNTHIYAQIIDDTTATTLLSSSDLKIKGGTKVERAKEVGTQIAKLAGEKNISEVVFDRNGFLYHGRVKVLADAARDAGLKF
ncbi:50S ribosomal protein L18 [Candidatus Gracilibacteria bacterium]|nr:50S ribosomal protein L18 [Candidatus Gracilibacteria bacterium]